ncbi:MAG TPA: hypothetical protein DDZ89_22130 [Clostridiales bacterium]|nr:hypothetical protein [Clostridiales bacterium]
MKNTVTAIQFESVLKPTIVELKKKALLPHQVGIKTIASSLCNHSEMRSFFGSEEPGYGYQYPMEPGQPGHEAVGIIEDIGAAVSTCKPGDLVVVTGHGGDECHRSYIIKDASCVARITPFDRDPLHASILEMFGCAYHCVKAQLLGGDYDNKKVAVIGLGAIGLCTIQLLRMFPTSDITAFDLSLDKIKLAKDFGADQTFLINPERNYDELFKHIGLFDVVIECSGHKSGHALAYALCGKTLIFTSYCKDPVPVRQSMWFNRNTTIYNPGILTIEDLKAVAALYNKKMIDPSPLITKVITPNVDAYTQTIYEIKMGEIIKALMDWRQL